MAASSASLDTSIVWTPAAAAPGSVTAVSPDSTIADGTVITFGQTFASGEIPSGQVVSASLGGAALPTQTVIKRRNADNSIRHAIISVRLPAASSSAPAQAREVLTLAAGSGASGTPLSIGDVTGSSSPDYRVDFIEHSLLADGSTAAPEAGKTWSASLKSALGGTTDQWLGGALVSEWRTRVAPSQSSTAHPALRVIFDARYQSVTQGRLSITLENVESNAARGDRIYDLRIYKITASSGTELVYSRDNIKHYNHTRLRQLQYFGSGSKAMMVIPDLNRLKASRAVPNYVSATVPESTLASRYSAWQTSARDLYDYSIINPYMPSTGGRWDIGPLPGWTAIALVSGDPRMYQVMFDLADRAGYWDIHWRDSLRSGATIANADVFSLDVHPQFSLFNPSSAADSYVGSSHYNREGDYLPIPTLPQTRPSVSWEPDRSHQPSLAYLPYVVTGDRFYLDELDFWASWSLMNLAYDYREGANGYLTAESQSRGQAWTMRTLGHAAWIAPEGDWKGSYFTTKLNGNLANFRSKVVPGNPLGAWAWIDPATTWGYNTYELPYASADVVHVTSPWMHNFVAYTLYQLAGWGFNASDLRDLTLGYTVKLFTSGSDFDRLDATSYRLPYELTGSVLITSMSQLNAAAFSGVSFATRNPGSPTTLPSAGDPSGYASIALATLAAAIDSTSGSTLVPSGAYVFVRDQSMSGGNSQRLQSLNDPTWNIVPLGSVIGLSEAPGIYPK